MALWGKSRASATLSGANNIPTYQTTADQRKTVATDQGWVLRKHRNSVHGGVRTTEEVLVHIGELAAANTMGFPDVVEVWTSSNTTNGTTLQASDNANVYVRFNEPVKHSGLAGPLQLQIQDASDDSSAATAVAPANNTNTGIILANNTLVFAFTVPAAGVTYKVGQVALVNSTAVASNLVSENSGNEVANLVINKAVSNAFSFAVVT